ncbi:MAG: NAD(P)H-hydrate dehydratase [Pseudomonadota bacterium]
MAEADRYTIRSGLFTGSELMERAGAAIMDVVLRDFGDAPRVHVLCGPGNNGGDGYVVARLLVERGVDVRLHALAPPKPETDAAQAAQRWRGDVLPLDAFAPDENDCVIDAIFGAGARGMLPEVVQDALVTASRHQARMVAVDLPSGIDGDTGAARFAVQCAATVTFFAKKPGHLLHPGRETCGTLHVADIGVRQEPDAADYHDVFENGPDVWAPWFSPDDAEIDTHKYQRGHVAVFSGSRHSAGASRLSALAAQRAGVGAVTLLGSANAIDIHASHVTSIMTRVVTDESAKAVLRGLPHCRAVVLGPGYRETDKLRTHARSVLEPAEGTHRKALVLDADGITAFKDHQNDLFDIGRLSTRPRLILTPHAGEFARLFPDLADDRAIGKLEQARRAAERANAVVVFKGPDTVIAAPRREDLEEPVAAINVHASPALATAGSGDVLAGLIAGFVARGICAFDAACAAVWMHGEAGMRAGTSPTAEDIIAHIGDALQHVASLFETQRGHI